MYTIPHLRAQTTPLPRTPELVALLTQKRDHIVWLRGGSGFVCAGVAGRFDHEQSEDATGEDGRRFALASQWWHDIVAAAELRDDIRQPGTGLVSFGSFSFAPASRAGSVLIVPQVVVGITADQAFLTLIGPTDLDVFDTLAPPARALLDAVLVGSESEVTPLKPIETHATDAEAGYRRRVEEITQRIHEGKVEKVVLTRQLDLVATEPIDERAIISYLAENYPTSWTFAIDGLVGATPEILAQDDGDAVLTRVLAGTVARGKSAQGNDDATALHSPKNLHEHQVAVDSAYAALTKIGTPVAGEAFPLELPHVAHLATDIRTELNLDADLLQVAGALHPTAALGGTPRERALEIIHKLETTDRDRFGAPVGWMDAAGHGQWCVALRCVRLDDDKHGRAWAGGGIMGDSVAADEYAETQAKFATILGAFGC